MISQVTANPKSTTSNEYGFYAIPKTIKPKTKYRQTQYQEEKTSKAGDPVLIPIVDQVEDQVERDFFVDQAPYPQFMPKQPGLDQETQVEDQELFDFNLQVEPLLQILVGQAVLKSRNQLQQQFEQEETKAKLKQFQKKKQAELMVTQRLQAHNRRRNEQNQRRLLQHQVQGKQKKLVLKKLHAVNQTKRALLNLKSQVLNQLEAEGFLRYDIFIRFRSQFLPWLYEQIDKQLVNKASMTSAGEQILTENQDGLLKKHKQNMQKEATRRKQILDQRQEQRLAQEQRKRKKAIRKQRLALNKSRKDKQDKVYQTVGKIEKAQKIIKNQLSDGRAKPRNVSYVSGGAIGYLSELLSIVSQQAGSISQQKLQNLIIKMLKQVNFPIDLNLPIQLKQTIEEYQNEAKNDPIQSNQKIENLIEQLVQNQQSIASIYESFLIHPTRNLKQIIKILLKIYLTQPLPVVQKTKTQEAPSQQQQSESQTQIPAEQPKVELSQTEKIRLSVKQNLRINFQNSPSEFHPSDIIRIRYPRKQLTEQNSQSQQYIQIFDGQGWKRFVQRNLEALPVQSPISLNFSGFETSFIYDEVSNGFYANYLLGLLNTIGIQIDKVKAQQIIKQLSDDHAQIIIERYGGKEIPIYDVELDL